MFEIRKAGKNDIPAVHMLATVVYADTFGEYYAPGELEAFFRDSYNLELFYTEFSEPGSQLFIALHGADIAGFLRLRQTTGAGHFPTNNDIELHQLYIHHNYHGSAVAAMIMEEAFMYAREKEIDWMWLSVWDKNIRAQKFYTKCGFTRFGEHTYMAGDDPQLDFLLKKKI